VKGAFSGAISNKSGKFEAADNGTIFLDEISLATAPLQMKLLRILESFRFEPVGSNQTRKLDVRLILATNEDLGRLVKQNKFREDLFYRINVVRMELPPLRERREDIPLLVDHFVKTCSRLNGKEIQGVAPEVVSLLMAHDFPGNIRELQNLIEYATVVCKSGWIGVEHLPDDFRRRTGVGEGAAGEPPGSLSWRNVERDFLLESLRRHDWNRAATADALGIHPSTLWRRIKRLGLPLPKQDGRTRKP
jgi:transcriptional regulator with PAS, ATPase and Fis domain